MNLISTKSLNLKLIRASIIEPLWSPIRKTSSWSHQWHLMRTFFLLSRTQSLQPTQWSQTRMQPTAKRISRLLPIIRWWPKKPTKLEINQQIEMLTSESLLRESLLARIKGLRATICREDLESLYLKRMLRRSQYNNWQKKWRISL